MRRTITRGAITLSVALLALSGAVMAQSSASYRIEEYRFGASGNPAGAVPTSPSFAVSVSSVGVALPGQPVGSPSFSVEGGFQAATRPPGEVGGLVFVDPDTLVWNVEPSAGAYNLYRDTLDALSDPGGGSCEQQSILTTTTQDPGSPAVSDGWFYLVTVENQLGEEGTRGQDSSGAPRPQTGVCP